VTLWLEKLIDTKVRSPRAVGLDLLHVYILSNIKEHNLQPPDAFSRLCVAKSCICGRGSALDHADGAYSVCTFLICIEGSAWGGDERETWVI